MLKVDTANDGQLKGSGNEILYDDVFSDAARVREAAGPAHKSEVSRADTGRDIHYTVFNDQVELVTICGRECCFSTGVNQNWIVRIRCKSDPADCGV